MIQYDCEIHKFLAASLHFTSPKNWCAGLWMSLDAFHLICQTVNLNIIELVMYVSRVLDRQLLNG